MCPFVDQVVDERLSFYTAGFIDNSKSSPVVVQLFLNHVVSLLKPTGPVDLPTAIFAHHRTFSFYCAAYNASFIFILHVF